jgi:hypothetical protein
VVRRQRDDGLFREPGRAGDQLGELGNVDRRQVLDGLVHLGLILRRDTGRVVDEEAVVGAPDLVEPVLGLGAVGDADRGSDVGPVLVQEVAVGSELLGAAAERGVRRLRGEDEVLAEREVQRDAEVSGRRVGRCLAH